MTSDERAAVPELVRLKADLSGSTDSPIPAGTVGTVVHVYNGGEAYEVEFTDHDGRTLLVATLTPEQLERP